MVRLLPPRPSLEHLKHQAKDLLDAYRQEEPEAQARFWRLFPPPGTNGPDGATSLHPEVPPPPMRLTQAQLVVAREYGFPSWLQLAGWVARGEIPEKLSAQVELLGVRAWRVIRAAEEALTAAGAAGIAAAIEGLSHPKPRVRRGAASFMDHHADDSSVDKLAQLALQDPVPYVRRVAVHALTCQRCKPAPLTRDVAPLLLRVAREDPNSKVQGEALWGLCGQAPDDGLIAPLSAILREASHPRVRGLAHAALKRHSPAYRQEAYRRAREEGMARQASLVRNA
jgi:hypothetical protein